MGRECSRSVISTVAAVARASVSSHQYPIEISSPYFRNLANFPSAMLKHSALRIWCEHRSPIHFDASSNDRRAPRMPEHIQLRQTDSSSYSNSSSLGSFVRSFVAARTLDIRAVGGSQALAQAAHDSSPHV